MSAWKANTSKGPRARDWKWTYPDPLPWTTQTMGRGDEAQPSQWMKEMSTWGRMVAEKCRDLEARVSELEAERDPRTAWKGGAP
jgi:hypothetical protein